ncbi:hypothetical protein CDD82_1259 [Ophiocordyceps australis]|uniref:Uncharacterized protein n=1 Tax=Ophiocordyceps australis TaxID=1399860 RepID=A0A2C5ZGS5_9HYPO|nr:hypothetical protein CDD82_1259 [Ophiocordyceps australis]
MRHPVHYIIGFLEHTHTHMSRGTWNEAKKANMENERFYKRKRPRQGESTQGHNEIVEPTLCHEDTEKFGNKEEREGTWKKCNEKNNNA